MEINQLIRIPPKELTQFGPIIRRIQEEIRNLWKGITRKLGKNPTNGLFPWDFKLHIAINEKGELCGVYLSKGNVDDRNEDVLNEVLQNVSGKLFADKGYISKKLFEHLYEQGITLITSVKKKMKNRLIPLVDKLLLRKRSVIETVNDQLKKYV